MHQAGQAALAAVFWRPAAVQQGPVWSVVEGGGSYKALEGTPPLLVAPPKAR